MTIEVVTARFFVEKRGLIRSQQYVYSRMVWLFAWLVVSEIAALTR